MAFSKTQEEFFLNGSNSVEENTVMDIKDILFDPEDCQSSMIHLQEDLLNSAGEDTETDTQPDKGIFQVDSGAIRSVPLSEQAEELQLLGLNVYDQTEFEEGILKQMDDALEQQEAEKRRKLAQKEMEIVTQEMKSVTQSIKQLEKALSMAPSKQNKEICKKIIEIKRQQENKNKQMRKLLAKQKALSKQLDGDFEAFDPLEGNLSGDEDLSPEMMYELKQVFNSEQESKQQEMIRTGQMTPFGTVLGKKPLTQGPAIVQSSAMTDFEKYLMQQAELNEKKKKNSKDLKRKIKDKDTKNKKKKLDDKLADDNKTDKPNHALPGSSKDKFYLKIKALCPPVKKVRKKKEELGTVTGGKFKPKKPRFWREQENVVDLDEFQNHHSSDDEFIPSSENGSSDSDSSAEVKQKKKKKPSMRELLDDSDIEENTPKKSKKKKDIDDSNLDDYHRRIRMMLLKEKHERIMNDEEEKSEEEEESHEELEGGFKIPHKIWKKLYRYQQTCVQWLWELHLQRVGGIVGDEMGLGKTIQIIAFLSGLWFSKLQIKGDHFEGLGPVIIVTPTTVMHQWLREFHTWWPPLRVGILHESGSYTGTKESLIRNLNQSSSVLITSYQGLVQHQEMLLKYDWHYIILDEGHKIRNPDAQITLAAKQFRTPHRLILSGSPLQNNLKELWSLFDFIFPGKLGTLPVFMQQFSVPITLGGYATASEVQVRTAYKCATVLRDTINPYLLRRMKADVKMSVSLPSKNEQVLFCRLTEEQKQFYKEYLDSDQVKTIMDGRLKVFVGLINLRKICNHPDLYSGGPKIFGKVDESTLSEDMRYGFWKRSGKMIVIEAILKLWHQQGHRVLLFTQSRQMLLILEYFAKTQGYSYLKMDGTSSISSRQPLINKYNNDSSIYLFILTTRVGGLGVNLIGANRVIIFDPDWNPSTDLQARERAWRIGQTKNVTVYRLLTSGTIEEKIYHRQIFKQFLTNRVLKDPRQRRFFKSNDLYELFSLQDDGQEGTETSAIFAGTGSEVKMKSLAKFKPQKKLIERPKKRDHQNSKIAGHGTINNFHPNKPVSDIQRNSIETTNTFKRKLFPEAAKLPIKAEATPGDSNLQSETELNHFCEQEHNLKNNLNEKSSSKADNVTDTVKQDSEQCATESPQSSGDSLSPDKIHRMRELARRLSEKIAKNFGEKTVSDESSIQSEIEPTVKASEPGDSGSQKIKTEKKLEKKKNHKHHKKKPKDAAFEGCRIKNLVKHTTYEQPTVEDSEQTTQQQDDYVLQKLFAKTGIQSAMSHDVIINSADPDYILVEGEAEKVAKDAVRALKQSRRFCYDANSGIPTWTGSEKTLPKPRFGQKQNTRILPKAKKPESSPEEPKPKVQSLFSPKKLFMGESSSTQNSDSSGSAAWSSAQLLARMKELNSMNKAGDSESEDSDFDPDYPTTSSKPPPKTEHDELLVDLRNFVAFQASLDGQATTNELLQEFKQRLPAQDSAVFKSLLNQICTFYRDSVGNGIWRLKPEFR